MRANKLVTSWTSFAPAVGLFICSGCATAGGTGTPDSLVSAQASQPAEQQCAGIPAKEQQLGLLAYRDAVEGARTLTEEKPMGKSWVRNDRGVVILLRAQPGLSAPWLARVAACHIALAREGKHKAALDSGADPLLIPGARVRVDEAYTGYLVSIHTPDAESAGDAMRRTQAMRSTTAPSLAGLAPSAVQ